MINVCYSTFAIAANLPLTLNKGMYLWRKGSIAGPRFKIPFMGPFIQALHPKFEAYEAQWASGALSCVSVFHKYASHVVAN
jgi:sterol 22-desaturase